MQRCNIEGLTATISESLKSWESEKWQELDALIEEKGNELLARVKRDAPTRTGAYNKGFKVVKSGSGRQTKMTVKQTGKKYRIMHLLEYGHAKTGGGRVRAYPHLLKNEKDVNDEFVKEAAAIYARE